MTQKLEKLQAKGIRWNTIMSVITFVVQFVALYFLNKLIDPGDFGKAIFAMSVLSIGLALANLSFAVVAIREKELTAAQKNTIFYFSLFTNVLLFIIFFFVLPAIKLPAIEFSKQFLKAFSFAFLIQTFGFIPYITLQRDMKFGKYSSLVLAAKVASLCGAIFFAIRGQFFWSLFFLYAGLKMIQDVLLAFSTRWRIGNEFDLEFLKKRMPLGGSFTLHQLVGTLSGNLASLLVGNTYGQQPVGEYHKSFGYKSLPIKHVASPIAQVMFPTFSKLQDDPKSLSAFFLKAQNLTGFLLLPVFFLLFALAKPFTTLYFDEDWNIERITMLLQIFSLAGALSAFSPNFYSFFSVVSGAKELNTIVITQRIVIILAILITFKMGIIPIAYGVLAAEVIGLLINAFFGKKYFYRNQLVNMSGIFFRVLFISIASAVVGYFFYHQLPTLVSPVVHFLLACITAAVFYLATSFIVNRDGFNIFKEIFLSK